MEIRYDIKDVFHRNPQFILTGEITNIRITCIVNVFEPYTFDYWEGPVDNYWLYDAGELYLCSPLDTNESEEGCELDTKNSNPDCDFYSYRFKKENISVKHKDVIEALKQQLPHIKEELKSFLFEKQTVSATSLKATSESICGLHILELKLEEKTSVIPQVYNPGSAFFNVAYDTKLHIKTYRLAFLPSEHSIKNLDTGEVYPSSILDVVDTAVAKSNNAAGRALYETIAHNVLNITDIDTLQTGLFIENIFIIWGKKVELIPYKDKSISETHNFT